MGSFLLQLLLRLLWQLDLRYCSLDLQHSFFCPPLMASHHWQLIPLPLLLLGPFQAEHLLRQQFLL